MEPYQPTSRRPIADPFRRTAEATVRWCVRAGVHPDAVSYGSIVAAAIAGICFWQSGALPALLIGGVLGCFVRLWLNMLDGMVALASGKASVRGELLNDLPDRISDVLIFAGVAHSGLCHPFGAYWVAILALLVAYVGMMGQALGVQREFSGWMSKPWRMVAESAGALITLGLLSAGASIAYGGWTVLDATHFVILAGCVQTIAIRLARILRALRQRPPRGK